MEIDCVASRLGGPAAFVTETRPIVSTVSLPVFHDPIRNVSAGSHKRVVQEKRVQAKTLLSSARCRQCRQRPAGKGVFPLPGLSGVPQLTLHAGKEKHCPNGRALSP